jgi:hypothetical protein
MALAAIWLWRSTPTSRVRGQLAAVAALGLAVALASQSVGAILLLGAGLTLLWTLGRPLTRSLLPLFFLLVVLSGSIYLSGAIPLRAIAENTVGGHQVVNFFRSLGRGSFTWRVARDQRALPLIDEHMVLGAAQWDWWRPNDERPWGLAVLVIGQFGLVGLALVFSALLTPILRVLALRKYAGAWTRSAAPALAVIVLMAIGDAMLNSFFFYPAILAAAALAGDTRGEKEHRRQSKVG